MEGIVGDAILLAVGVALSPLPILAVVGLLLSVRPRQTGLGFTCGWTGGIALVVTATSAFARYSEQLGVSGLHRSAALIEVVLGAAAIAAGAAVWLRRPSGGGERQPRWLAGLDGMSVRGAVLLGAALSILNPKNLLAGVLAGLMLGSSGLSGQAIAVSSGVFTLIASSTVVVPMVIFLVAGRASRGRLSIVRGWLVRHHAGALSLSLVVIGALWLARGLAGS